MCIRDRPPKLSRDPFGPLFALNARTGQRRRSNNKRTALASGSARAFFGVSGAGGTATATSCE
eukprot:2316854-Alexandrium_andersonii.AAC.1